LPAREIAKRKKEQLRFKGEVQGKAHGGKRYRNVAVDRGRGRSTKK